MNKKKINYFHILFLCLQFHRILRFQFAMYCFIVLRQLKYFILWNIEFDQITFICRFFNHFLNLNESKYFSNEKKVIKLEFQVSLTKSILDWVSLFRFKPFRNGCHGNEKFAFISLITTYLSSLKNQNLKIIFQNWNFKEVFICEKLKIIYKLPHITLININNMEEFFFGLYWIILIDHKMQKMHENYWNASGIRFRLMEYKKTIERFTYFLNELKKIGILFFCWHFWIWKKLKILIKEALVRIWFDHKIFLTRSQLPFESFEHNPNCTIAPAFGSLT